MVAGRPVPLVGDAVAFVGDAVAVIGHALAFVSGPVAVISEVLARIGGPVARIGGMVALVRDAVALLGSDLGLVKRGAAPGQVGLGGLEGLLGGLGAGLGLPDPDVVQGQGGQPLPLGVLDDLAGQLGQLARGRRARRRSCPNAASGSVPWMAARTPLACSIQIRLVSACCSWATSSSSVATSTLVCTSSPATLAN